MSITVSDATALLPQKAPLVFARKSTIYSPAQPCDRLYVVRSGRVVVSNHVDAERISITRIVGPNGIFGEGALSFLSTNESAATLEETHAVAWTRSEIEDQISREPMIGLALLRYFTSRCGELNARLEAIAFHQTTERVMLGLMQLAESLGKPAGAVTRLAPLTHQVIAGYIGTSREIVTAQMAGLRRAGLLKYSRQYIDVHVALMQERLKTVEGAMVRGAG